MNIYILHGGGEESISKKIDEIKKDHDQSSVYSFLANETKSIPPEILNPGLFEKKRLLILENFDFEYIEKLPEDDSLDIIFKFSTTLSSRSKFLNSNRKNLKIYFFPEEKDVSIFSFLDSVAEKNPKALASIEGLYDKFKGQYILTMLLFSLRRLILPSKSSNDFVLKKIEKLKKNFTIEKIKDLYFDVLQTDYKIKTGILDEKTGVLGLVLRFITV